MTDKSELSHDDKKTLNILKHFSAFMFYQKDLSLNDIAAITKKETVRLPRLIGKEFDYFVEQMDDIFATEINDEVKTPLYLELIDWFLDTDNSLIKLINAYGYGWIAQKENKFLLPMAETEMGAGLVRYAFYNQNGFWDTIRMKADKTSLSHIELSDLEVNETQLRSAPAWVKAIEKVEVNL